MIFWLLVVLLVVGITLMVIGSTNQSEGLMFSGLATSVLIGILLLSSLCIIVEGSVNKNPKIEKYKIRYESLVYQYENDLYENDNDVGKRELMADIEAWNTDLAYWKEIQRNFWVGIFIPDIYDEFEYIELK